MLDPKYIQLLILPGLGGDHRMAHSQLSLPYESITPDYIPFEKGESLVDYSYRFYAHILNVHTIDLDRPFFIAGYSLGSAIGQELAKYLPVRGLILIGGPMSGRDIRLIPWLFGKYFCWWLPLWVYRAAEMFVSPVMRIVSGISEHEIKLAGVMYHELARGLFREGYRALVEWKGCDVQVPFIRIHGESDQIIKCPKPGEHVIIIPHTKHLVGQARPGPVNAVMEKFILHVMTGND
jgi:pimeloyl-ACP methyl ester carboxylesterase